MNIRHLGGMLVALLLALPAAAMTTNLGQLDNTTVFKSFSGISAGSYSDIFTFSLSQPADTYATGMTTYFQFARQDIQNLTLTLVGPGENESIPTQTVLGGAETFSFEKILGLGSYTLTLNYTVPGGNTGAYGIYLGAVPVPEPTTLAMMLSGLGLIGLMVRGRK